jgi:hypothetical protein
VLRSRRHDEPVCGPSSLRQLLLLVVKLLPQRTRCWTKKDLGRTTRMMARRSLRTLPCERFTFALYRQQLALVLLLPLSGKGQAR